MNFSRVAILSPGDMGHAVGRLLREHGLEVITCLSGRSERTRRLAEAAGITEVPTLMEMVAASDAVLSITVSEAVPDLCREVAGAVAATGSRVLFAECNAIAPQTARRMEPIITRAGGRFVDASIIGSPPRDGSSPRFYASGPHAAEFEGLREFGLDVRNIGPEVGQASGIKMAYAASTKGTAALYSQLLLAAKMMRLYEPLAAELQASQEDAYRRMERWVPGLPAKSRRWVSEMQEIEATFHHLGLTPDIFRGVTEMYRFVGATPMGEEKPETRDTDRTLADTIGRLAEHLPR